MYKLIQLLSGSMSLTTVLLVVHATTIVLAQSGLTSMVTAPGAPRNAAYAGYPYPQNISEVPSARWIWDGPGNVNGCYMDITVE